MQCTLYQNLLITHPTVTAEQQRWMLKTNLCLPSKHLKTSQFSKTNTLGEFDPITIVIVRNTCRDNDREVQLNEQFRILQVKSMPCFRNEKSKTASQRYDVLLCRGRCDGGSCWPSCSETALPNLT